MAYVNRSRRIGLVILCDGTIVLRLAPIDRVFESVKRAKSKDPSLELRRSEARLDPKKVSSHRKWRNPLHSWNT